MSINKISGHEINVQKSITFPYTSTEQVELEIKNIMPLILANPQIKHLGINLTQYVQDPHEKNCKTLIEKKKLKYKLNIWRDISHSWK